MGTAGNKRPIDLLSCLVSDELALLGERLLERRKKKAQFRDSQMTLDNFDFAFNKKMNPSLVFDLGRWRLHRAPRRCPFSAHPGTGKSHLAQAIGQATVQQGYRVPDLGMRKLPLTAAEELWRSSCAGTSAPAPC